MSSRMSELAQGVFSGRRMSWLFGGRSVSKKGSAWLAMMQKFRFCHIWGPLSQQRWMVEVPVAPPWLRSAPMTCQISPRWP